MKNVPSGPRRVGRAALSHTLFLCVCVIFGRRGVNATLTARSGTTYSLRWVEHKLQLQPDEWRRIYIQTFQVKGYKDTMRQLSRLSIDRQPRLQLRSSTTKPGSANSSTRAQHRTAQAHSTAQLQGQGRHPSLHPSLRHTYLNRRQRNLVQREYSRLNPYRTRERR
ncbi:hypothetical protein B0T10DRAFT_311272 [Thelonectria olida]|uniref:Uncharacterized protein n=1 Tax=Thelonectria olida TaxID=1576542 RepID=A0A9P8W5M6_9HYPO|nr:hypothetical protein B0T10DRAFT_311272 [Thelonectria olida]